jgi:hypothetical protein
VTTSARTGEQHVYCSGTLISPRVFLTVDERVQRARPGLLRLTQNPSTGFGGTCYGDSGGPNFLGARTTETNIIAGITITGDVFCRSTNVTQRLDTEVARAFLGQFVTLP